MRVLIAYDGSTHSRAVFDDLARAALPSTADALVLTVGERWLPFGNPEAAPDFPARENTSAIAEEGAAQLRTRFPDWKITAEARQGSPARCIVETAREWSAHFLALGALGHSAFARALIGSVSAKVADEAMCTVRIARPNLAGHAEGVRIVIGYDGLPEARKAVEAVAARPWPRPAAVRLLTCVGFGSSPVGRLALDEDYQRARALQAEPEAILTAAGLACSSVIREDDPKMAIPLEAESLQADCVFLGCNDEPFLSRLLLGSVSAAILGRSPCSVEIVR